MKQSPINSHISHFKSKKSSVLFASSSFILLKEQDPLYK